MAEEVKENVSLAKLSDFFNSFNACTCKSEKEYVNIIGLYLYRKMYYILFLIYEVRFISLQCFETTYSNLLNLFFFHLVK